MCEQKFEQEQNPLTPGRKILWIVAPEDEKRISADLSAFLENFPGRIVYNNLRSCDEIPEWERTRCDTPEAILSQIEELQSGDCYILDCLQFVYIESNSASDLLSFGKKLFQMTTSSGIDCLIVALHRSGKEAECRHIPVPTWLQELKAAADIVFEDEALQPSLSAAGEPIQLHLQVSGHKYKITNQSTTFKTGEE